MHPSISSPSSLLFICKYNKPKRCICKNWSKCQLWTFIINTYIDKTIEIYAHHREYREHVKDLSCISEDLCRIVIVDNNPFSFLLQPLNGIPCIPFSAGQPYDDQVNFTRFIISKVENLLLIKSSFAISSVVRCIAFGGSASTPKATLHSRRCQACALWEIPNARMVPVAWNSCYWFDIVMKT